MAGEYLPKGWSLARLGDLGEVNRGRSRHRPRYAEHLYGGPYPFIQTGDIKNSGGRITTYTQTYSEAGLAQSRLWPAGTMCITIAANIAETGILGFAACFPDSVVGFIPDETKCDGRFVEYTFRYLREQIQHEASGSVQDNINLETLDRLRLPLPPLPEQRAIAHILGTLDDKIEVNRRMSATLEAMARAIFKSWFVDFDPVRGKMEKRWRRGESLPGLPAHLYDLFPDRLVDSELGEIPQGWGVATLPQLIEVNPSRPLRKGQIAPYLDMANMPTRGHAPDEVIERPFGSGMRFINGDTLVARITPCLENGKTAFVDFLQDGQVGWGSTEYIVLRPKPPLPEAFAYCLARSDGFREFAIQSMTGTSGRQRVQADSLAHFQMPRVPQPVAEAFGRAIGPLFVRSSAAVRESRTLAALRDALLPKLISGELRVKDAEKFIGRAV
jgi:type I restriction enzyme S subunit